MERALPKLLVGVTMAKDNRQASILCPGFSSRSHHMPAHWHADMSGFPLSIHPQAYHHRSTAYARFPAPPGINDQASLRSHLGSFKACLGVISRGNRGIRSSVVMSVELMRARGVHISGKWFLYSTSF